MPIFYEGFKNLEEIPKTKSIEAIIIENFIANYKGEKRINHIKNDAQWIWKRI